ncbi:Hypothetical protein R9X50_00255300 [Acrodontium crateriforme]|uniref:Mitochondrial carrier protein n=1 Tax=Acrodontium crateriforme TaxID=150365 RepID=A0AAQ3M2N6_9PEZI|nr:Hypothetical protein R9X50_00255300 [Acrodontium crateriforme]
MSNSRNTDIWIAGAFAAFTVDAIIYPLDTIKTRWQSPDYHRLYTNAAGNGVKRSMFKGVYQGVGSVILATLPSSGAFFTTYEGIKYTLENNSPQWGSGHLLPTPLIHATASGVAELVSCAILTPAEVIKQNAQMVDNSRTDRPRVNATLETAKRFRSNPIALWRGYTALASRNLPFTALQFPMFERIKEAIKSHREENGTRTNTILETGTITAISAGLGGSIAAVVTTPIDVVKTRIMLAAADSAAEDRRPPKSSGKSAKEMLVDTTGKAVQSVKENLKDAVENIRKPPSKQTSMQIAQEIIRDNGVKGLFRGGAIRGIWTMLGAGLYLGTYDTGRMYLASRRGEEVDEDDLA